MTTGSMMQPVKRRWMYYKRRPTQRRWPRPDTAARNAASKGIGMRKDAAFENYMDRSRARFERWAKRKPGWHRPTWKQ